MNGPQKTYAGLDMGSAFTKAVILRDEQIIASALLLSGGHYKDAAQRVLDEALSGAGVDFKHISGIVVTGLGAGSVPFPARNVSDISCQAMGCRYLFPSARTVIDIGGQFTKAARITPQGRLADFLISEKCATGSGRFLQIIARILQVKLEDIGPLSLNAKSPVEFSTNCAVFAESETVSRIAERSLQRRYPGRRPPRHGIQNGHVGQKVENGGGCRIDRRGRRRRRSRRSHKRCPEHCRSRAGTAQAHRRIRRCLPG